MTPAISQTFASKMRGRFLSPRICPNGCFKVSKSNQCCLVLQIKHEASVGIRKCGQRSPARADFAQGSACSRGEHGRWCPAQPRQCPSLPDFFAQRAMVCAHSHLGPTLDTTRKILSDSASCLVYLKCNKFLRRARTCPDESNWASQNEAPDSGSYTPSGKTLGSEHPSRLPQADKCQFGHGSKLRTRSEHPNP